MQNISKHVVFDIKIGNVSYLKTATTNQELLKKYMQSNPDGPATLLNPSKSKVKSATMSIAAKNKVTHKSQNRTE